MIAAILVDTMCFVDPISSHGVRRSNLPSFIQARSPNISLLQMPLQNLVGFNYFLLSLDTHFNPHLFFGVTTLALCTLRLILYFMLEPNMSRLTTILFVIRSQINHSMFGLFTLLIRQRIFLPSHWAPLAFFSCDPSSTSLMIFTCGKVLEISIIETNLYMIQLLAGVLSNVNDKP